MVLLAIGPWGDGKPAFRFLLRAAGDAVRPMEIAGPLGPDEARRRFGAAAPGEHVEYWLLRATLAAPRSFVVFYDRSEPGHFLADDRECAIVKRIVLTVFAAPNPEPLSVAVLSALSPAGPTRRADLKRGNEVDGTARYRSDAFALPANGSVAAEGAQPGGFDVSLDAIRWTRDGSRSLSVAFHQRYQFWRSVRGAADITVERYAWNDGDAIASHVTSPCMCRVGDRPRWVWLDAGDGWFAAIRLDPANNGMLRITALGAALVHRAPATNAS